eukprot:gene5910-biopygen1971
MAVKLQQSWRQSGGTAATRHSGKVGGTAAKRHGGEVAAKLGGKVAAAKWRQHFAASFVVLLAETLELPDTLG